MVGVGETGLLSTMAVHVTEGSAQTVSTPEAEERAGAQNPAAIGPQLRSQGVALRQGSLATAPHPTSSCCPPHNPHASRSF